MGAKIASKQAKAPAPALVAAAVPVTAVNPSVESPPSWLDSSCPRKRMIGKIVLASVWLYVAALWLLALDQTFHWGIFGPKLPPAL